MLHKSQQISSAKAVWWIIMSTLYCSCSITAGNDLEII